MGIFRSVTKGIGYIFDFRIHRWLGFGTIKKNTQYYYEQAKALASVEKPTHSETFEEAAERLNLSPEFLERQKKRYLLLSIFFVFLALSLGVYAGFFIVKKYWMGAVMCCSLTFFALTYAFRYHFWYFQIKHKKLGCKLRDWFRSMPSKGNV